jgi:hypothetical protein
VQAPDEAAHAPTAADLAEIADAIEAVATEADPPRAKALLRHRSWHMREWLRDLLGLFQRDMRKCLRLRRRLCLLQLLFATPSG